MMGEGDQEIFDLGFGMVDIVAIAFPSPNPDKPEPKKNFIKCKEYKIQRLGPECVGPLKKMRFFQVLNAHNVLADGIDVIYINQI
jgi:hypothetical protein